MAAAAIQHGAILDELEPEHVLQLAHLPHQRIDRAAGHAGGSFVHRDEDELIVTDLACRAQRHAMRHPLFDEGIGFGEHAPLFITGQRAGCRKNPEPGVCRQLVERDTRHDHYFSSRRLIAPLQDRDDFVRCQSRPVMSRAPRANVAYDHAHSVTTSRRLSKPVR